MGYLTEGRWAGPRRIRVESREEVCKRPAGRTCKQSLLGRGQKDCGSGQKGCGRGLDKALQSGSGVVRVEPGCGRDRPIFGTSWTLGASAGPRPLTVATRYCRVPQSSAAEAHLQVLQGEAEVRGQLESPSGTRGFWVLHPHSWLLPAHRRPTPHSCPRRRGRRPLEAPFQSICTHLCTLSYTPRLCIRRVPVGLHHQARAHVGPTRSTHVLTVPLGLPPLRVNFLNRQCL